jgi:TetR/AcrR family transcriptional regulator, transcriptional repressor for nem operon
MGYSRAEKAQTHERIVALAAKRFRQEGLNGIGIAELMKQAGLTVGGFYKHFDSRDELVTEALRSALNSWERVKTAAGGPRVTFASFVDKYLSEAHRDNTAGGCPIAALAPDIARMGKPTRGMVTREIQGSLDALAGLVREDRGVGEKAARSWAILAYCAMVGAIGTARAVSDPKLFREILKTVADLLKRPNADVAGEHPRK